MNTKPTPNTIYRHFKGNLYQVKCIANHSETGEEMVVYQALYGDYGFYVRPLEMFMSKVDKFKYPDVKQEYRFEAVQLSKSEKQETPSTSKSEKQETPAAAEPMKQEMPSVSEHETEGTIRKADEDRPVSIYATQEEDTPQIDPDVLDFLDADTYEQRLEILGKIKYKITDDMISIMSTVIDIDVPNGDVNKRYEDFKEALLMRRHYECNRFRP